MNALLLATAATVAMALADVATAGDVRPEIGAGIVQFTPYGDGTWYQLGMQHRLGLAARSVTAGLTGSWIDHGTLGLDWHADYVDFGSASSSCACTPLDSNYDTATHSLRPEAVAVPNATFIGHGRARGLMFKLTGWREWRGLHFGIDAGLGVYHQTWRETALHWSSSLRMTPRTVTSHASRAWHTAGFLGVSFSRGRYTVSFDHYAMPFPHHYDRVPALWNGAGVLSVTYRFGATAP